MQIKLKKNTTYLTRRLEGLHVNEVAERKGTNILTYTIKFDSDDETDLCSSEGIYLKQNMVLTKNNEAIETIKASSFGYNPQCSFISDNFDIYQNYDTVINSTDIHNFISSITSAKEINKIYQMKTNLFKKI